MNALEHEQLDEQLEDELDEEHEDEHEDDELEEEDEEVSVVSMPSRWTLTDESADIQMELIKEFIPVCVRVSL